MSSSKRSTTTTQQQQNSNTAQQQVLNPVMQDSIFGNGGLISEANRLYQAGGPKYFEGNTYAGLNDTQNGALNGLTSYLQSPQAMAGYNAMNSVGQQGVGSQAQNVNTGVDTQGILAQLMGTQGVNATLAPDAANAAAGSVNYQSAINPYLNSMLSDIRGNTINDFNRNVAPMARSGAQMAGGFGGSRQGVVEANAMNDLGRNISTAQTGLLGQITEADANRRLSADQTNASLATQAALANAAAKNNMGQFNASAQNNMGQFNAGNELQRQGLGLNFLTSQRGQDLTQAGMNQNAANDAWSKQLQGAGLLQSASQIPMQNYQGLLAAGGVQQADQQNQINADLARWNFNQQAPWQNLSLLQGALGPFAELGSGQVGSGSSTMNGTSTTKESTGGLGNALGTAIGLGSMLSGIPGLGGALGGLGGAMGGGLNAALLPTSLNMQQFQIDPSLFQAPNINYGR